MVQSARLNQQEGGRIEPAGRDESGTTVKFKGIENYIGNPNDYHFLQESGIIQY